MNSMRDLLELQILEDARNGDTTILAEILNNLKDEIVYASLCDKFQNDVKTYYDVHITYDTGGYSIGVVCDYPMEEQRVIDLAFERNQFEESGDAYRVDSVEEIDEEVYNEQFKICEYCGTDCFNGDGCDEYNASGF